VVSVRREPAGGRPPSGGLLAVHAHPDDETLSTGGLLATWADAGRPVTVVTCTRGELGEVIGAGLAHLEGDGAALAAHREGELAAALAALGVADHLFLDTVPDGDRAPGRFSDSGMAWTGVGTAGRVADLPDGAFVGVPLDVAARRLARVLRSRRPDVVVTYEPGGGYGHPDHVRAHDVTLRALELAADANLELGGEPHAPGAVLVVVVPAGPLRSAYRALVDLPAVVAFRAADPDLTRPDPDGPLPSVAVPAARVDVVVDAAPVLDRVAAAMAAHGTQVRSIALDPDRVARAARAGRAGDREPVVVGCYALSNDVLLPLLSRESYAFHGAGARAVTWPAAVRPVA
jgi:N-acetyl-1-D-myo-inositol-2-amino-2-deoxy-alpha-D-glucopyranoside deacetylase